MDLALLYLSEGRLAKVRDIAVDTVAMTHAEDMDIEVQAGLLMFQQAAQNDAVTEELVKELVAALVQSKEEQAKYGRKDDD